MRLLHITCACEAMRNFFTCSSFVAGSLISSFKEIYLTRAQAQQQSELQSIDLPSKRVIRKDLESNPCCCFDGIRSVETAYPVALT